MTQKHFSVLAAAAALCVAAPVLGAPAATPTPAKAAPAAFATVAASSPAVTGALAATDLAGARKLIGKNGAFQGTVTKVYSPGDHDLAILDFAADYQGALTGFVGPNDLGQFGGLAAAVQGKRVLISGTFISYKGRPEIVLTSPHQIALVR